jgi:hypothetical protein
MIVNRALGPPSARLHPCVGTVATHIGHTVRMTGFSGFGPALPPVRQKLLLRLVQARRTPTRAIPSLGLTWIVIDQNHQRNSGLLCRSS